MPMLPLCSCRAWVFVGNDSLPHIFTVLQLIVSVNTLCKLTVLHKTGLSLDASSGQMFAGTEPVITCTISLNTFNRAIYLLQIMVSLMVA